MIVYEIMDDGGSSYFATLGEAREALHHYPTSACIEKLWLADLPPKQLAVRLLNHEKFVADRKAVV